MSTITFNTDQDAAHVAAFEASVNGEAMVAHLRYDHGVKLIYSDDAGALSTLTGWRWMHASIHAVSDHPHLWDSEDHTCHAGPLCGGAYTQDEQGDCGHPSCQELIYELCIACQIAADDERGQFDPILCKEHGWTYITDAGSNSGFAGEGVWWANYACGCGEMEEGAYTDA